MLGHRSNKVKQGNPARSAPFAKNTSFANVFDNFELYRRKNPNHHRRQPNQQNGVTSA